MKAIKHIIIEWIKIKRLNVFVLFLMISILISIIIKLSNESSYTLSLEVIPIHHNLKEVLLQKNPKYIDVTLKSSGFRMLKYVIADLKLPVDFNSLNKSNNSYFWGEDKQRLLVTDFFGSSVDIMELTPKNLTFEFEEQSVKTIPVKILSNITLANGYDFSTPLGCFPDSVDVVGSKKLLKQINEIYTFPLKIDNLNSNINESLELDLPKHLDGLILSQIEVDVIGTVEKYTEGVVRVPVRLINVPNDQIVSIFPKEISVVFYTSLKEFKSISAKDFIIECDFNALDDNDDFLIPKLTSYPNSAKRVSLQSNQIQFVIKAKYD